MCIPPMQHAGALDMAGKLLVCTMQISLVVWMFQYPPRTAVAVGLSMAQIGEFAFVLLSSASQHGLLAYQVYMLLMGTSRFAPCIHLTPELQIVNMCSLHCGKVSYGLTTLVSCDCAGVTGLSLLITPFIMQLSTRYLQLDSDDGKVWTLSTEVHSSSPYNTDATSVAAQGPSHGSLVHQSACAVAVPCDAATPALWRQQLRQRR